MTNATYTFDETDGTIYSPETLETFSFGQGHCVRCHAALVDGWELEPPFGAHNPERCEAEFTPVHSCGGELVACEMCDGLACRDCQRRARLDGLPLCDNCDKICWQTIYGGYFTPPEVCENARPCRRHGEEE